jgi:drug/metabolite transporter, DME family
MGARLSILVAALLFGTTGTARALGPAAPATTVGAVRIVVGGLLLLMVAWRRRELTTLRDAPVAALALGVGVAVYQLAFFGAIRDTGVAVGTVVAIGSAPVAAGLVESLVERVRPSRRWGGATILAAGGVSALTVASAGAASLSPAGIALALVAGAGYASYAVGARRLIRHGHPPAGVMAAAFGAGGALLLPILLVGGHGELTSPSGVLLAVYLGLAPTALGYLLYAAGLRRVTAAEAATLTLAEPVTATFLGLVVLGERLDPLAAAGAALVLSGLVVLAAPRRARVRRGLHAEAAAS